MRCDILPRQKTVDTLRVRSVHLTADLKHVSLPRLMELFPAMRKLWIGGDEYSCHVSGVKTCKLMPGHAGFSGATETSVDMLMQDSIGTTDSGQGKYIKVKATINSFVDGNVLPKSGGDHHATLKFGEFEIIIGTSSGIVVIVIVVVAITVVICVRRRRSQARQRYGRHGRGSFQHLDFGNPNYVETIELTSSVTHADNSPEAGASNTPPTPYFTPRKLRDTPARSTRASKIPKRSNRDSAFSD